MKCPSFERLIDYLDGRFAADEASRVTAHIESGCQQCAASREWYEKVRLIAATDDMPEPPPWVLKHALRIFENRRARPRLVERLGRAVAWLVFDSLARPAVAGVRSTETSNRQLLYRAGDYSIDLQVAPSSQSRADLIGQVLREGEAMFGSVADIRLELSRGGEVLLSTAANEMGEFVFKDLGQGEYDLLVETPEGSITVQGLPITESS